MNNPSEPQRLRHVVIGVGAAIFASHRPALALETVDLVAVCGINPEKDQSRADELGCAFYVDYQQMLAETRPDVAVILTPPFLHAPMTLACLQAGCHVLVEKPMARQVAEADQMIAAAHQQQRLLGVVFQQRFRPEIQAARKLLHDGVVGNVQRVELSAVWTRPASYFALASWRATWSGEGGGVLTNQAAHNLDLLCYLLGSPVRLVSWTRRLLHRIETEDTVHAMLEWADGALGSLHISTAEADDDERFKIVGTRGSIEIGRGSLRVYTLDQEIGDYIRTCQHPYTRPARSPLAVPLEQNQADHLSVYRQFHRAILSNSPDYCDGEQARRGLEVANALNYASQRQCEVVLPLDRLAYAALLDELQ